MYFHFFFPKRMTENSFPAIYLVELKMCMLFFIHLCRNIPYLRSFPGLGKFRIMYRTQVRVNVRVHAHLGFCAGAKEGIRVSHSFASPKCFIIVA
uniref:Uncharacterized protein n=1 Tax=Anguilla anguilla TaxID=7936 RepID=A0A0E9XLJ1_ANGAN